MASHICCSDFIISPGAPGGVRLPCPKACVQNHNPAITLHRIAFIVILLLPVFSGQHLLSNINFPEATPGRDLLQFGFYQQLLKILNINPLCQRNLCDLCDLFVANNFPVVGTKNAPDCSGAHLITRPYG
jgi:hypothetical protein